MPLLKAAFVDGIVDLLRSMDKTMAEEEYTKKLQELQRYIPFLENMIVQLKDPKKKNREAQLRKMESLHAMITDKRKRLKLDTLKKCEDVILKLHGKVKMGEKRGSTETIEQDLATPRSPSPPGELPAQKPIVIPTEKITNPFMSIPETKNHFKWENSFEADRYHRERPDIYSCAAQSLNSPRKSVFERLGVKIIDTSKPPLSNEDLELLIVPEEPIKFENKTERIVEKEWEINKSLIKTAKPAPLPTNKNKPPRVERIIKNPDSPFGNILSNIDRMIIKDEKKERKEIKKDLPKDKYKVEKRFEPEIKPPAVAYKRLADKYNPRPRKSSTDIEIKPVESVEREGKPVDPRLKPAMYRNQPNTHTKPFENVAHNQTYPQFGKPQYVQSHLPAGNQFPPNQSHLPPNQLNNHINLMNQAVSNRGNTYVNTFIVQQNTLNNINQNQYGNNHPPFEFQPKRSFHPYEPIVNNQESKEEYDLAKVAPIDYYPPHTSPKQPLLPQASFNRFEPSRSANFANRNRSFPRFRNEDSFARLPQRSRDDQFAKIKQETFASPLDSLYTVNSGKTGKGYGIQNFKIPKKKKPPSEDIKVPLTKEVMPEPDWDVDKVESEATKPAKEEPEKKTVKDEPDKKPKIAEAKVSSNDQSILTEFITNLIGDANKKVVLMTLFNTLADGLGMEQKKKFKRIQKIVDSDSSDEEPEKPVPAETVKEAEEKPEEVAKEPEEEVPPKKRKVKKKVSPKKTPPKQAKTVVEEAAVVEETAVVEKTGEEQVVESVGERTKNRKRVKPDNPVPRKPRKCKTELEMLHEDIKEMFICDGVLTATGKRMCCILKGQSAGVPNSKPIKPDLTDDDDKPLATRSAKNEKTKKKTKETKKTPRIAIEKTDLNKVVPSKSPIPELKQVSDSEEGTPVKRKAPRDSEDSEEEQLIPTKKRMLARKSHKRKLYSDGEENSEDEDEPIIEPDKDYYFEPKDKFDCKICQFKGKMIVQHYRSVHPKHEVQISRINPKCAERAIAESQENDYEKFEPIDIMEKNRKRKFTFRCVFCQIMFKNETTETFYDHLTGHTGEYRFTCPHCPFKTANVKSLKAHFWSTHPGTSEIQNYKPLQPSPPNYNMVFGYMCACCNYVQMERGGVKAHIRNYHDDVKEKIVRISMSLITTVIESEEEHAEEQDVMVEEEIAKQHEVRAEAEISQVTKTREERDKSEEMEVAKEQEKDESSVKECDANVFTCNADIEKQNMKIEEERLKKMMEVNEFIKPRTSSSFIERLQTKLQQKIAEPETNESERQNDIPISDENIRPVDPVEEKQETITEKPTGVPIVTNDKHNDSSDQDNGSSDKVNDSSDEDNESLVKNNEPMSNIIQRLQGKLVSDDHNKPGPLMGYTAEDKSNLLRIGPFGLDKGQNYVKFSCFVAPCAFFSESKDLFKEHCKFAHGKVTCNEPCKICSQEFVAVPVTEVFQHLLDKHTQPAQSEEKGKIFLRRLSGDELSKKKTEEEVPLMQVPELATSNFPFQIINVTSLTPEQERMFHNDREIPSLVPQTPAVMTPLALLPSTPAETAATQLVPSTPAVTAPTALEKSAGLKKIILKDVPLSPEELAKNNKSKWAMLKMLTVPKLRHLYKCPEFNCTYTTDGKRFFETHLKQHRSLQDGKLVRCVYCNFKTLLLHVPVHVDIRHGRCTYGCSYCFYRAISYNYVQIHQSIEHCEKAAKVLKLRINQEVLMSKAQTTMLPFKKVIMPFECGQPGCDRKFLLPPDFMVHLNTVHILPDFNCRHCDFLCQSVPALMNHLSIQHHRALCQCRYCAFSGGTVTDIQKHFAFMHPANQMHVVIRKFNSNAMDDYPHEYEPDDETIYQKLKHVVRSGRSVDMEVEEKPITVKKCYNNKNKQIRIPLEEDEIIPISDEEEEPPAPPIGPTVPIIVNSGLCETILDEPLIEPPPEEGPKDDPLDTSFSDTISSDSLLTPVKEAVGFDEVSSLKEGYVGTALFRCGTCDDSFDRSQTFRVHLNHCIDTKNRVRPFKCRHCVKSFKASSSLIEHIRLHGTTRFRCSLCNFKHSHQLYLKTHMKTSHKVTSFVTAPADPTKSDIDRDEFIVRPKNHKQKDAVPEPQIVAKEPEEPKIAQIILKSSYSPLEIDELPRQAIYNVEITCSVCSYATKVRTNLIRHLQFHTNEKEVPVIAPVNPVPCLGKTEKMFDKMTNLAMSSFTATSRMAANQPERKLTKEEVALLPSFVPVTKRYVCGAVNCNYLCLEESMLRHHLMALHGDETCYKCSHCDEKLSSDKGQINVDVVVKHLKLHDLHLYKCPYCKFLHNLKHKVERHQADRHQDKPSHVLVVREIEHEPEEANKHEAKELKLKPWRCALCKYRCVTLNEISAHAHNKHSMETRHKCALCSYQAEESEFVRKHFAKTHPNQATDIIVAYYSVAEPNSNSKSDSETFDTTPLWQRDRPRVKHIRGILLEDTGKSPKKSPVKATDNLDRTIEAVACGLRTVEETRNDEDVEMVDVADKPDRILNEISIANTSREDLLKTDLMGTYGPYGKPFNLLYLCPLCAKFKCRSPEEFNNHLCKELDYTRYSCNYCSVVSSITPEFIKRHMTQKHPNERLDLIKPKAKDEQIEDWIRMVTIVQKKLMEGESTNDSDVEDKFVEYLSDESVDEPPLIIDTSEIDLPEPVQAEPVQTESLDKHKTFYCAHCSYNCKYLSDLRKHEKRHWLHKPKKCGNCSFDAVTNTEVTQHSKRAHPNVEVKIITVETPNSPVIIPINRKRKLKVPDEAVEAKKLTKNEDNCEKPVCVCNHCGQHFDNYPQVDSHWEEDHKPDNLPFQFIQLVQTKQKNQDEPQDFKCAHCSYINSLGMLKAHYKKVHAKMKFIFTRYKCDECEMTFKSEAMYKNHQKQVHTGEEHKKVFACEHCPESFDLRADLIIHHQSLHSHLDLNLAPDLQIQAPLRPKANEDKKKYMCPQCKHTSNSYNAMRDHLRNHAKPYRCSYCPQMFSYPSFVKHHQAKEHSTEELKYETLIDNVSLNVSLRDNLLVLNGQGVYVLKGKKSSVVPALRAVHTARKSTTPHLKPTARKSTTKLNETGWSFYGTKPENGDLKKVFTTVPIMGTEITMFMDQLSNFFNFFPTVEVVDCVKSKP